MRSELNKYASSFLNNRIQQIEEISGNHDINYVPNHSPQRNLQKGLEKDCQNNEKNHPVSVSMLVRIICQKAKRHRRDKPHKGIESIRHMQETQQQQHRNCPIEKGDSFPFYHCVNPCICYKDNKLDFCSVKRF